MNKQEIIDHLRDIADEKEFLGYTEEAQDYTNTADALQKEPNPIQDIVKLNEERYGLSFNTGKEYDKLKEEMDELLEAIANQDVYEMIDAWNDILVIVIGSIRKAGYNPELTLNEVVKEISSRQQDPKQRDKWANGEKEDGEKWQKNTSVESQKKWYKADFSKCKL